MSLYLNRDLVRADAALSAAATALRRHNDDRAALRLEVLQSDGRAAMGSAIPEVLHQLARLRGEAEAAHDSEAVALALEMELRIHGGQGDVDAVRNVFRQFRELLAAEETSNDAKVLCLAGLAMQATFGDPVAGRRAAEAAVSHSSGSPHRLKALARLLVVLQCQGEALGDDASRYLAEARALADKSGDRLIRFNIESNRALALLDAGELDRAEVAMERAEELAASPHLPLFSLLCNRAELALARQDFLEAEVQFRQAGLSVGPTAPSHAHVLVSAGLGLCALELGDLAEARRREASLPDAPDMWAYDPALIVSFRCRMLERRGGRAEATAQLRGQLEQLRPRFCLCLAEAG